MDDHMDNRRGGVCRSAAMSQTRARDLISFSSFQRLIATFLVALCVALAPGQATASPAFAGTYQGTYTGDMPGFDFGTFLVTVDSAGNLTGTGFSQRDSESFSVSGLVDISGSLTFSGLVSTGGTFTGTISSSGVISGTWADPLAMPPETGTFTGNLRVTGDVDPDDDSTVAGAVEAGTAAAFNASLGQRNNFNRRIQAVRGGARGVNVSNLSLSIGGVALSPDMFGTGQTGLGKLASGLAKRFGGTQYASADRDRFGFSNQHAWYDAIDPGAPSGLEAEDENQFSGDQTAQAGDEMLLSSRWGTFVNGNVIIGDRDSSSRSIGFDDITAGVSAGVDYRVLPNLVAGVGAGYSHTDTDFDGGGDSNTNAYYGVLYATADPVENVYVDAVASLGGIDFDTDRRTASGATAESDTDGVQFWGGVTGGYTFVRDAASFGPYVRVNGAVTWIDDFSESGAGVENLLYDDQTVESFSTVLGGRADYAISTEFGVVVPYLRAEYEHEFADSASTDVRFATDPSGTKFRVSGVDVDRDFFNLGGGVSAVFAGSWSAFLDYDGLVGAEDLTRHSITFGVRKEF